ncbi:MAG: putative phosphoserine phosphatase / 1-acylglycerol-3-phosphate O-acyltransferase [Actinomycetota bacterium]|nr:putative phosphoserine phosphatase / 1-acylglycerol-3-phosphate O-acyltransferase [Actinomycetota bacterium]
MTDIQWLLEDVEASPDGPQVAAFFDFDGTLIDGFSAKAFFKERLKNRDIGLRELLRTVYESASVERRGQDISKLMDVAIGALAGRPLDEINEIGEELFRKKIAGMIYPDARALLAAHVEKGHTLVIASSATPPQIEPAARELGVPYVLATRFEVSDGTLTGRIDGDIRWGPGKAAAVTEFAAEHEIDLAESFAYANGTEDLEFLAAVGRPRPLNPEEGLTILAEERGWPTNKLFRPKQIGPTEVVRSALAYGSLGFGFGVGAVTAAVNGSRRSGANLAAAVGSDLALAAGGIQLNVIGQENLWAARPAVFLFNHQSQLDVLILGALLRQDFTGVAKIQASHDPLFAPIGYLADVAYVDRGNTTQARQALAPVVAALKGGRSIAISPEGTRSVTERILPFKKGAFHMAMQAGVPIVPIVVRNAGELMRPNALFMAPGRLDVRVLEPISTDDWTVDDLEERVAEVRQLYIEAMSSWPRYIPHDDD